MENSKIMKLLDALLVIITLTAVFILLYIFLMIKNLDKPHNVVLPAISRAYAEGMVKENECYIVYGADPEVWNGRMVLYGRERKNIYAFGRTEPCT